MNLFSFLNPLKIINISKKGVILSRGTYADATWHARPRGRATRTHASAYMARRWCRHVAVPRESMWTLGWRHLVVCEGFASEGPTG